MQAAKPHGWDHAWCLVDAGSTILSAQAACFISYAVDTIATRSPARRASHSHPTGVLNPIRIRPQMSYAVDGVGLLLRQSLFQSSF
jgi:hypothetical protein